MKGFGVQYPFVNVSPSLASGLLASLSFVFMILTGLAAGGMVYALAAQVRGRRSVDPRWDQLARAISSRVVNLMVFGVGLSGSLLWLAQTVLRPMAAAEFQKIFQLPMRFAWGFLLTGMVALFLHTGRWNRLRSSFPAHFGVGVLAAVALFAASALPVSMASFSMTPGFWHNTRSTWDALLNPSFAPAYLVWCSYSLAVSGGAGLIYAALRKDDLWRSSLAGWLGVWTIAASIAGIVFTAYWVFVLFFRVAASVVPGAVTAALALSLSAFLFWTAVRRSEGFGLALSAIAAVVLLAQAGGIYRIRTHVEGPFSIQGYLFRNGILISEIGQLSVSGLWKPAPWRRNEPPPSGVGLGAFSFRAQCFSCHSKWLKKGGLPALAAIRYEGDALSFLGNLSSRHPQLPIFGGNRREKKAAALYLEKLIRDSGGTLASRPSKPAPAVQAKPVPAVRAKPKPAPPVVKKTEPSRVPASSPASGGAPVEAKPADTKPAKSKPADTKPAEAKQTETKPAVSKPAGAKPAEGKPGVAKPARPKPSGAKPDRPAAEPGKSPDGPGKNKTAKDKTVKDKTAKEPEAAGKKPPPPASLKAKDKIPAPGEGKGKKPERGAGKSVKSKPTTAKDEKSKKPADAKTPKPGGKTP